MNIGLPISGFHMLTQELIDGASFWKDGSKERLRQIFPASTKKEVDGLESLAERYHKYKKEYVKHLSFNPKEENLSKCILNGKSYERKKQTFI